MSDVLRLTVRPDFIDSELHLTLYQDVVPNLNTIISPAMQDLVLLPCYFAVISCINC